jgi:hypothetical protein
MLRRVSRFPEGRVNQELDPTRTDARLQFLVS